MRARMTHILCAGAGAIVFSILLSKLTLGGLLTGAFSGLLFAAVIRPVGSSGTKPYRGLWLLRYGALLLRDMVIATAQQMRAVLRRVPTEPAILHLTPTAAERGRVLVANSITLTPGTVTLEETEDEYAILCAEPPNGSEARRAVAGSFEARLHEEEARS